MTELLLLNLSVLLGALLILWLVSLRIKDASVIDAFWGFAFVGVAWVSTFSLWPSVDDVPVAAWVLVGAVTIWGGRLGSYLTVRFLREEEEDRRYVAMRDKHGDKFWWVSLFTVFGLQGVLAWLIALPIQLGLLALVGGHIPSTGLLVLGAAVWAVGLTFEALGDAQLAAFKADESNRGEVLDTGLWRWTRHPNYFGDALLWWGHFVIAVAVGAPWWTIVGPVAMTVLLMKVSGVTLLEKDIADRRPGYREYIRRTNAFFPGPRKSAEGG